jgi:pteridine reductase
MKIADKHVLITGGGKRIGRQLVESFTADSARVTVTYLTTAPPKNVFAVRADLKSVGDLKNAVTAAVKQSGPIDILINNASQFTGAPFLSTREAVWDDVHATNVRGHFFLTQACVKHMTTGVIINIVDVFGRKPLKNFTAYSAAKAGLQMLTRSLALELSPRIRVNSVSPGPVLLPDDYDETLRTQIANRTLLKRLGNPLDVVNAVRYLVENDYVTGTDLVVDGGLSIHQTFSPIS